jgi:hypothetical protein
MKKLTSTLALFSLLSGISFGQLNKVNFLAGGINDAQVLFKSYLNPWAKSIGAGLDAGWYNTSRPHSTLGFDVTLTTSFAMVPSSDKTFEWDQSKFNSFELKDATNTTLQTVAGKDSKTEVYINKKNTQLGTLNLPGGTDVPGVPIPMVKAALGLPYSTEIDARFLPSIKMGDYGKLGMWGVGIKHSIKQWIPVINHVPFWDLSFFGAYSHFGTSADVKFTPESLGSNFTYSGNKSFDGQSVAFDVNSMDFSLLISTCLPVFNVYGGIGYTSSTANLKLKGNYYVGSENPTVINGKVEIKDEDIKNNPVDMKFDKFSNARLNAGMRLKLALLTIHVDYTYANYSIYSMGLGISFR